MTSGGGGGRVAAIAAQIVAIGAAAWFLVVTARAAWPQLSGFHLAPAMLPLTAASVLTAATYFFLVGTWSTSLRWWNEHLAYRHAARMWFLTNLARFIPGTIWQFAGLGAMALARGISPLAATGAVLLQQVVLLATGVLVTVALAPNLVASWAPGVPRGLLAAVAVVGAGLFVWLFPRGAAALRPVVARLAKRDVSWPAPPPRAFAVYVAALIGPWVAYGVAFWLFGRSLYGVAAPGALAATAAFTASYVAGIIAVFAPGGIVVREAALVAALAPQVGPDRALVLAVGSRVWLVAVELVTAVLVLMLSRRSLEP